jgi:hypothetical protein
MFDYEFTPFREPVSRATPGVLPQLYWMVALLMPKHGLGTGVLNSGMVKINLF